MRAREAAVVYVANLPRRQKTLDLIIKISHVRLLRPAFVSLLLPGKAQARELWDHSKQKKNASCFGRGLLGEPKLGSALLEVAAIEGEGQTLLSDAQ
jgi:hypothetical protein